MAEPAEPADFSALDTKIAAAVSKYGSADEGDKLGQYSEAAMTAFQTAITTAQGVRSQSTASQAQVDTATSTWQRNSPKE